MNINDTFIGYVMNNNITGVINCLTHSDIDINVSDSYALIISIFNGYDDIFNLLLDNKCIVNRTCITYCIWYGNFDMFSRLIKMVDSELLKTVIRSCSVSYINNDDIINYVNMFNKLDNLT